MINLIFSSVFTTAKNASVLYTFAEAAAIKNQKSQSCFSGLSVCLSVWIFHFLDKGTERLKLGTWSLHSEWVTPRCLLSPLLLVPVQPSVRAIRVFFWKAVPFLGVCESLVRMHRVHCASSSAALTLAMVVHTYDPRIQRVKVGRIRSSRLASDTQLAGQPGLNEISLSLSF